MLPRRSAVYYSFLRERWSALLIHGVAALIAGRREQRTTAGQHLREGLALPIENLADRENRDFLVAAHALSLEQSGKTRQAMVRLAEMMPRRDGEMTLTHQWLPDLVRLALAAGDRQVARAPRRRASTRPRRRPPPRGRPQPACGAAGCCGPIRARSAGRRALPVARAGGGVARGPGGPGCRAGEARPGR